MCETAKENKMGTMPVGKLLVNISLPIIISMLVQALYNIVDSYFVAKLSETALTAVSLAFPVQNIMISIAVGTGVGMNAFLSKSLGEKNENLVHNVANNGMFLFLLSYVVMAVIGFLFSGTYFSIQTDINEVIKSGTVYTQICTMFSIGVFTQIAFERYLQATGKTVYSMITQLSGAIINIILDPILIFGLYGFPAMGVAGAAVATVIGQICSTVAGFFLNHFFNHEIKLSFKGFRPDFSIIKRIYSVGFPSILMRSVTSVMSFGMNGILLGFSSTAAAVLGIYMKLESFVLMPVYGLNNGMVPILAYNYGAKNKDRIIKTIKLSLVGAVCIMLFGFALMQLFSQEILLIFNASENMLSIGTVALKIISFQFLLSAFSIVFNAVFQAFGKGFYSLTVSLIRQLIVLLPVAFIISKFGKLDLVWLAFPIAEVVSLVTAVFFMKKVYNKNIKPIEK